MINKFALSRNFEDSLMAAKTQIVSFDTSCVWDDFVFRSDETVGFIFRAIFHKFKKKTFQKNEYW